MPLAVFSMDLCVLEILSCTRVWRVFEQLQTSAHLAQLTPLLHSIHRPSALISLLQTCPPSPHFTPSIFLQLLALSTIQVFSCLKKIGRSRRSFPSVLKCSSASANCISGREDLLRLVLGNQNRFGEKARAKFK